MLVAAIYSWAFTLVIIRWRVFENGKVHILELVFPVF